MVSLLAASYAALSVAEYYLRIFSALFLNSNCYLQFCRFHKPAQRKEKGRRILPTEALSSYGDEDNVHMCGSCVRCSIRKHELALSHDRCITTCGWHFP